MHEHGNYYGYYGFRTQTIPDARLSLLPRELFADRRILDLGCNAGKLTLEVLNHLGATRARGVDIDAHLISQAEAATNAEHVEWTVGDFMEENYEFGDWDTVSSFPNLPMYRTDPFTCADHAAEHHQVAPPPPRRRGNEEAVSAIVRGAAERRGIAGGASRAGELCKRSKEEQEPKTGVQVSLSDGGALVRLSLISRRRSQVNPDVAAIRRRAQSSRILARRLHRKGGGELIGSFVISSGSAKATRR